MKANFDIDINVVYTTTQIGPFFRLKSRTPLPVLSRVVYKFTCLGDQTNSYIGMTERHVTARVAEHLQKKSTTAVAQHIKSCQACKHKKLTINDFKILQQCRTDRETKIYEALKITSQNPKINRQLHRDRGASFLLNIFN